MTPTSFTLTPDEKSLFAANVEQFMLDKNLPGVVPNGSISTSEAATLTRYLMKLEENPASGLKGEIKFDENGAIRFTVRALSILGIQAPGVFKR